MRAELYRIVDGLPGTISTMPRPRGGEWLEDEMISFRDQGVEMIVSLLTAEEVAWMDLQHEELHCVVAGLEFRTHPIPDMEPPRGNVAAEAFVPSLAAAVADGRHLAIHCRGGIGRASTIAGALLVAMGWSTDDAFDLIGRRRGHRVPETAEQRAWVEGYEQRRRMDGAGGL